MVEALFGQSVALLLFLAGATLLVAEAFAPGAHLFVIGVALLTAGVVGLVLGGVGGLGVFAPIILAAVVIAVTGLTLWGYRRLDVFEAGGTAQTSDSDSLRGQIGRVTERVTTSEGAVKLEDGGFNPNYRARSVDGVIGVGTEVMVVDPGGGNVVTVTPVSAAEDDIDRELARGRSDDADDATDAERAVEEDAERDVEFDDAS